MKFFLSYIYIFVACLLLHSCSNVAVTNKPKKTLGEFSVKFNKKYKTNHGDIILLHDLLNNDNSKNDNRLFFKKYGSVLNNDKNLDKFLSETRGTKYYLENIESAAKKRVEIYKKALATINKKHGILINYNLKFKKYLDALNFLDKKYSFLPIFPPQENAKITSHYGSRYMKSISRVSGASVQKSSPSKSKGLQKNKTTKTRNKTLVTYFHHGLDIQGPKNNPILSSADGKVCQIARTSGYGNMVLIDHGNGFKTRYAHLSYIAVREGEMVIRVQEIGNQGRTGRATGDHLHFEIILNGKAVNPMDFLWHEYLNTSTN